MVLNQQKPGQSNIIMSGRMVGGAQPRGLTHKDL